MRNITFKQYRNIDILIFAGILTVSETITTIATNKWFDQQPVAISTSLMFICIIMMRWNWLALIPAALGGLVFCIASGAKDLGPYVTYVVGNCMALAAMIWFKVFKKDDVRKNPFKLVLFVATAYLTMQLGRWLVSLCFGSGINELISFLSTDTISLLFAVVIMMLMRSMDGMIEDQKAYLFRLQREREEKQKESMPDNFGSNY